MQVSRQFKYVLKNSFPQSFLINKIQRQSFVHVSIKLGVLSHTENHLKMHVRTMPMRDSCACANDARRVTSRLVVLGGNQYTLVVSALLCLSRMGWSVGDAILRGMVFGAVVT